ncbi:hypothetical protein VE03_03425 [Pseudogymnoascus sp. 23342-1-I1]|nr:hypothetical protein VE03_03425 [Pseudogymnoascus sp. 23342-1-I1]
MWFLDPTTSNIRLHIPGPDRTEEPRDANQRPPCVDGRAAVQRNVFRQGRQGVWCCTEVLRHLNAADAVVGSHQPRSATVGCTRISAQESLRNSSNNVSACDGAASVSEDE